MLSLTVTDMKIITSTHKVPYFSSRILDQYFKDLKMGIFDIETLGLSPQFAPLILAGFMTVEKDGSCQITQYFAETPGDERYILEYLREDFDRVDYLLTYNGKHFDLPFVRKRAERQSVPSPDCDIYNMDLYLIISGHSEIRNLLKHLKQKDIEIYMGLAPERADDISGAESVDLYKAYLSCLDPDQKEAIAERILLHNHDDILQLYQLLPILKQVRIHKALNALGFAVGGENGWPSLSVSYIKVNLSGLSIKGKYRGEGFSYMSYDTFSDNFSCKFDDDKSFESNLRIERHKGNIFANLRMYFDDYEDLKVYPHYLKDFLLLSKGGVHNSLEVNMFVRKFLIKFMNDHVCPRMLL